jgi:hypothetical protein
MATIIARKLVEYNARDQGERSPPVMPKPSASCIPGRNATKKSEGAPPTSRSD